MKNYILQAILVIVLLSSCAPTVAKETATVAPIATTAPQAANTSSPKAGVGKTLDGVWSHECDVLGFKRYTWTGAMTFSHADMVVRISFDDWDTSSNNPSSLAFIILSPKPDYKYDWLYVLTDGTFDPKLTYFDTIGPMEVYPGGYPAFEKELRAQNIDWVNMYKIFKTEFLIMYYSDNVQCMPEIRSDTHNG